MTTEVIYIGNDNILWVRALTDSVTGLPFDDANSVQVTLFDCEGNGVAGTPWPLPGAAVGDGTGDYYANLPDTLELTEHAEYTAQVEIDDGPDRHASFAIPLVALKREC
ncbi:MAG: hypothetical protein ACYTGQ_20110 [Planctomycetota bacterium]|jgi:hypothetical protein